MFNPFKNKAKAEPAISTPVTLLPGSEGEHCLQGRYSTKQRAYRFYDKQVLTYLAPLMQEFIGKQEILFIATADKHGECDCSFRFGRPGFVRVLNEHYLIYPEYRGNGVLASQGNIFENPHIGMIFVDFFDSTVGLHVNGKAKLVEADDLLHIKTQLSADMLAEINSEGKLRPERWIMVEIDEAYIHCSKHIPLLSKADKAIAWGSDDDGLKRSDFFGLQDIPLYQRLGGDAATLAITETITKKLLQDNQLKPIFNGLSLQSLLNNQQEFFNCVFGAHGSAQRAPDKLREFYRHQTHPQLTDANLDIALNHVITALYELDVPEHEIISFTAALGITNRAHQ